MSRVFSALALLPIVIGLIWFSEIGTVVLAEVVLLVAFLEYASLTARAGAPFPRFPAAAAVLVTCGALSLSPTAVPVVLLAAVVAIATAQLAHGPPPQMLASVSAATFAVAYLALPLGAIAAVRLTSGPEAVLLLLLTVMASDTAQYYGGRRFGRRPLAPVASPNKTMEGALFGFAAGMLVLSVAGHWWLPEVGPPSRVLLGATIAGLGIAGDLFESNLKRIAQVKDASSLIPGHGGVLDRIDGLLFAAPVYFAVVQVAE
jgi:phosphatidate cytidylyltransferase